MLTLGLKKQSAVGGLTRRIALVMMVMTPVVRSGFAFAAESAPISTMPRDISGTRDRAYQRMIALTHRFHPVSTKELAMLNDAEYAALLQLAADPTWSVSMRAKALAWLGSRPNNAEAIALWQNARQWPERELRIQAAYAQAMASHRDPSLFVKTMQTYLADSAVEIREVAVQVLFASQHAQAAALMGDHLEHESDPSLRQVIAHRMAQLK